VEKILSNRSANIGQKMKENLIYGIHAVQHALKKDPSKILEIFSITDNKNKRILSLLDLAQRHGIRLSKMDKSKLSTHCGSDNNQGIAATVDFTDSVLDEDNLLEMVENKQCTFLLILDEIQDPHNLGAILRTADTTGVQAVVVPQDNSVKVTSAVRKVACGAAESVPFVEVKNIARFLKSLKSLGVWIVGTDGEQLQTIYEVNLTGPIAIVLGAEGKGLRKLTATSCDYLVSIPMYGSVESLNVSVSAGVCLYEVVRQRMANKT